MNYEDQMQNSDVPPGEVNAAPATQQVAAPPSAGPQPPVAMMHTEVLMTVTTTMGAMVHLHSDGSVRYENCSLDQDSKDLLETLIPQFFLLNKLHGSINNAINLDMMGKIKLITVCTPSPGDIKMALHARRDLVDNFEQFNDMVQQHNAAALTKSKMRIAK